MDRSNARSLRRLLTLVFTGIVVSWLGMLTLVALSFLWPANQVPHVLLGVWLGVITAYLLKPVLPGAEFSPSDSWPRRIAFAPLVGPVAWIGLKLRRGSEPESSQLRR
jgi:zinc transporter ZupT